jgi:anti-sigma regulatory factor (Ser/Thr protein kinase)
MTRRRHDRAGSGHDTDAAPPPPFGPAEVESLLDDIDKGRGARDAVVLPVPSTDPAAVTEVRTTLRSIIESTLPADSQHDVQLVSSELVTNALEHGVPPVRIVLRESDEAVVIAVFDRGAGSPSLDSDESPGLRIVDDLTDGRWGVVRRGGGKWVWAQLPRLDDPAA